jgi:hypothetical protein
VKNNLNCPLDELVESVSVSDVTLSKSQIILKILFESFIEIDNEGLHGSDFILPGQRQRQGQSERDRETERQREREGGREGERERQGEREREREGERERRE